MEGCLYQHRGPLSMKLLLVEPRGASGRTHSSQREGPLPRPSAPPEPGTPYPPLFPELPPSVRAFAWPWRVLPIR